MQVVERHHRQYLTVIDNIKENRDINGSQNQQGKAAN